MSVQMYIIAKGTTLVGCRICNKPFYHNIFMMKNIKVPHEKIQFRKNKLSNEELHILFFFLGSF